MYHYFYVIENLINGKVYAGKHTARNLVNSYMGSGKLIRYAIQKHGVENFRKHILITFASSEEAFQFENKIIDEDFVKDKNTYNIHIGGRGGFLFEEHRSGGSKSLKNRWANFEWRNANASLSKERMKRLHKEGKIKAPNWTGRKHSSSAKLKMSRSKRQLSDAQMSEVIEKFRLGSTRKQLAIEFNTTYSIIKHVISGRTKLLAPSTSG